MNKYRFILGKSPDTTSNLVTNGTFTGSLAGWTVNGTTQWAASVNAAAVGGAACGGGGITSQLDWVIKQLNVIKPNNFYYLQYKLKSFACAATGFDEIRIGYSLGGNYSNYFDEYDETDDSTQFTTYTHEYVFAPSGNDLSFYAIQTTHSGFSSGYMDDVVLYPYVWNTHLNDEPIDWDQAKIIKKRDEVLNGLIIEYIADLTFIGDGYEYLYAQYLANGFCGEIPVLIQIHNPSTNVYEKFFEGIIFIADSEFNVGKKQVKVKIEDNNASLLFIRSKDVKIDLAQIDQEPITAGVPLIAPYSAVDIDFNDDAGFYVYSNKMCYDVSILLKAIIMKATKYRLDATSTFFTSGTFDNFCIGFAGFLRNGTYPNSDITKISIKQIFDELNNLFDISFSITTNADGVPTIKIEDKVSYLSSTPVLILDYIDPLQFVFDKTNIVRVVNIGYENVDDTATTKNLNTPEGTQYFTNNICSDKKLDLVSKWIQKSTILKKILAGTITSDKYDNDIFWIETTGILTKNTGTGTHDYNFNIDEQDNMTRWIQTLQLGIIRSNLSSSTILTKTNAILDKIYSFSYPLTKAQFDLIVQAYNTIEFNTDGTGITTKEGYLLEANFNIANGLTEFKLLSN